MHYVDQILNDWANMRSQVNKLDEEQLNYAMRKEMNGRKRRTVFERLHSRATRLRAVRERQAFKDTLE